MVKDVNPCRNSLIKNEINMIITNNNAQTVIHTLFIKQENVCQFNMIKTENVYIITAFICRVFLLLFIAPGTKQKSLLHSHYIQ